MRRWRSLAITFAALRVVLALSWKANLRKGLQVKAVFYAGNQTISAGDCTPVPPKTGEVQLKVAYGGICGTDLHIYHGNMDKRVSMPQVIGHEISGVIS